MYYQEAASSALSWGQRTVRKVPWQLSRQMGNPGREKRKGEKEPVQVEGAVWARSLKPLRQQGMRRARVQAGRRCSGLGGCQPFHPQPQELEKLHHFLADNGNKQGSKQSWDITRWPFKATAQEARESREIRKEAVLITQIRGDRGLT